MEDEKTEVPGLFRANGTGALINKDSKALEAYRKRKQSAKMVPALEKRVQELEAELSDIKSRLLKLENK